jgi:hypothetical protein
LARSRFRAMRSWFQVFNAPPASILPAAE